MSAHDPRQARARRWTPASVPEVAGVQRMAQRARARFADQFGAGPGPSIVFAPGRVNLIGEHTDYNEGFVLPIALDRGVTIAFRAHEAGGGADPAAEAPVIRVHSSQSSDTREARLGRHEPRQSGWFAYVAGVAASLWERDHSLRGADMVIESDLPIGAGLSSSAALEVAVARALLHGAGAEWDALEAARICQAVENDYVGVACGIMDQYASAASVSGTAMLLDCRSMHSSRVRVPESAAIVVIDTGARRSLAASSYNERRESCRTAVRVVRSVDRSVYSLRDVDSAKLGAMRHRLDPVVARRAEHVVDENARVLKAAVALDAGDLVQAGRLMSESHRSLRDLYEVSGRELDLAVDASMAHGGCFGARMTGAGFGGCAIALVASESVDDFIRETRERLRSSVPALGDVFACRPAGGARVLG